MKENTVNFWDDIYQQKVTNELSWSQERPHVSLRLIASAGIKKDERIIDVGSGKSTLVDHLVADKFINLSVLDISTHALLETKRRLGSDAARVQWLSADVLSFIPQQPFQLWHDRAVFHFLIDKREREAYLATISNALDRHGHFIIATFALTGPKKCSGLEIMQYDSASLARFFGGLFELLSTENEIHITPWGMAQEFVYCHFRKLS